MRDILKTIKERFILLAGMGLFTYGLFSFKSDYYLGKTGYSLDLKPVAYPIVSYYYYDRNALILLTIGAVFIVIGLLKMRKKKDEN